MKICYIVAMRAEAHPFIEQFGVQEVLGFFAPLPCILYHTTLPPTGPNKSTENSTDPNKSTENPTDKSFDIPSKSTQNPTDKSFDIPSISLPSSPRGEGQGGGGLLLDLYVVLNGEQHGSDLVGCEAASVATLAAIQHIHPDLIINSGTCGAFACNGAQIGDVFLGNAVMFHDRRVPGDDAWGTQALGNYPVWDGTEALAQKLGFKLGKVTTGSSLDMQPCDLQIIQQNHGQLKDMEGAAVAFVCSLFHTPILFVKSVTDLCDSGAETYEEFSKNLALACQNLKEANARIIQELCHFTPF